MLLNKFIGIFFMLGVFTAIHFAEAVVIKNHVMTNDPKENTSCETPASNNTFSPDDETAYSWISIDGGTGGDDIRWKWYSPDSTLHQEWANISSPFEKFECSWSPLNIQGNPPANMPGNWYVDLYYNGIYQFTENFTITSKDPCPTEEIYGEYSEEVEMLRFFRDNVLSQTPEGQEIIRLYYEWSPAIVKAMEGNEGFKEELKEMIDGILGLVRGEAE